mmetsp:Transcript_4603/g.5649  ORF Transcript_4603/g.5649 Transcript_4603/m.5649 type:complete len:256 (-) Transcript_4603:29-796(-)
MSHLFAVRSLPWSTRTIRFPTRLRRGIVIGNHTGNPHSEYFRCVRNYGDASSHAQTSASVLNQEEYSKEIESLCTSNRPSRAIKLFERMRRYEPTFDTYFAIITGLCKSDAPYKALELLEEMKEFDLKPTVPIYNALIAALLRSKKPALAKKTFVSMREDQGLKPNTETYDILITGYFRNNKHHDVLTTRHSNPRYMHRQPRTRVTNSSKRHRATHNQPRTIKRRNPKFLYLRQYRKSARDHAGFKMKQIIIAIQ